MRSQFDGRVPAIPYSFPQFIMPKFRVTYVDSVLREAVVEADSAEAAEAAARLQLENAEHHHACDAWNDEWAVDPYRHAPLINRRCFECSEIRE